MKKILIDSGPLIALFDASDKHHRNVINFIKNNKALLISTIASVTETLHLLDFNRNAQIDFLEWVNCGAVEIHNIENKIQSLMNILISPDNKDKQLLSNDEFITQKNKGNRFGISKA